MGQAIYHLVTQHWDICHWFLILLLVAVGLGVLLGGGGKFLLKMVKAWRGPVAEVVVNPPNPGREGDYCSYPCEIKKEIYKMALQQRENVTKIAEVEHQQSKMWERLEIIPEIKEDLGEIKGMLKTLKRKDVE